MGRGAELAKEVQRNNCPAQRHHQFGVAGWGGSGISWRGHSRGEEPGENQSRRRGWGPTISHFISLGSALQKPTFPF